MTRLSLQQCTELATAVIRECGSEVERQFVQIVEFLAPDFEGARGSTSVQWKSKAPSREYIEWLAKWFVSGRQPFSVSEADTVPDVVVDIILANVFDVSAGELTTLAKKHQHSMMAENAVGDLLERYLASRLENRGWVWCSGSVVTAVDFLKFSKNKKPVGYQLKNRHNSENSSSSKVRSGTKIEKWYRYHSKKGTYHWGEFPDDSARSILSEDDFREFVKAAAKEFKIRRSTDT